MIYLIIMDTGVLNENNSHLILTLFLVTFFSPGTFIPRTRKLPLHPGGGSPVFITSLCGAL